MEFALRVKIRKEFDKQLGPVNFAMASRECTLAISAIINDDILYVVSEPDTDYGFLPKKKFSKLFILIKFYFHFWDFMIFLINNSDLRLLTWIGIRN